MKCSKELKDQFWAAPTLTMRQFFSLTAEEFEHNQYWTVTAATKTLTTWTITLLSSDFVLFLLLQWPKMNHCFLAYSVLGLRFALFHVNVMPYVDSRGKIERPTVSRSFFLRSLVIPAEIKWYRLRMCVFDQCNVLKQVHVAWRNINFFFLTPMVPKLLLVSVYVQPTRTTESSTHSRSEHFFLVLAVSYFPLCT